MFACSICVTISASSLPALPALHCSSLRQLVITNASLDRASMDALHRLSQLTALRLPDCQLQCLPCGLYLAGLQRCATCGSLVRSSLLSCGLADHLLPAMARSLDTSFHRAIPPFPRFAFLCCLPLLLQPGHLRQPCLEPTNTVPGHCCGGPEGAEGHPPQALDRGRGLGGHAGQAEQPAALGGVLPAFPWCCRPSPCLWLRLCVSCSLLGAWSQRACVCTLSPRVCSS